MSDFPMAHGAWLVMGALFIAHPALAQAPPTGDSTATPPAEATTSKSPVPLGVPLELQLETEPQGTALTEREAVQLALGGNPILASAELNLQGSDAQVRAADGRYPVSFLADGGVTRTESPQLRADDSVAASATRSVDASVALRRQWPIGTVAEVRATNQFFDREQDAVTVSPFLPADSGHAANVRASVTQPLMRGFGRDIGEAELHIARVNRDVNELALTRVRSTLIRDVLTAYYELWYSSRALEIERHALALAREQERQANERVAQGALSSAELFAFQSRSSELDESVLLARLARRQRSITLAQLLGQREPVQDLYANTEPQELEGAPARSSLEAALASDSVELGELNEQVRLAEVRARTAGEASRPRLDADAYVQTSGIGIELPRAWQRSAELGWWSAHVGLSLELPLSNQAHDAERAQARLAVQAARAQLTAAKNRISADAVSALANQEVAQQRLEGAQRTLEIAERAYEAAAARFELGQTIALTLHQAEDDLRRAQLRVARARVDASVQGVSLRHLSGELGPQFTATSPQTAAP